MADQRMAELQQNLAHLEDGKLIKEQSSALHCIGRVMYHISTTVMMRVVNRFIALWDWSTGQQIDPNGALTVSPGSRWRTHRRNEFVTGSVGTKSPQVMTMRPSYSPWSRG